MPDSLFTTAATERLSRRSPLAARLRPNQLDEIVGQDHLVGEGKPLRCLVESDQLSSLIFWGPPGTGKTSLARLVAKVTAKDFIELSAVNATVKDVRETIAQAEKRLGEQDIGTILFLDEVHRFNKAQQDALLPSVETGLLILIGATTENPFFEVNPPLLSRSTLFRLEPLSEIAIRKLLDRGLTAEGLQADEDALNLIVGRSSGDGRHALTSLEVAAALAMGRKSERLELVDAEFALGTKALSYGRDDHFDVISAFIKSIRGSDVDAGLYWLAVSYTHLTLPTTPYV